MFTGGRRTDMFFRMLRLLGPVGTGSSLELPRCEQHADPLHHGIAEKKQAESQGRIIAWFLVQPMNIATGRFGSNPMIAVARSNGK